MPSAPSLMKTRETDYLFGFLESTLGLAAEGADVIVRFIIHAALVFKAAYRADIYFFAVTENL